MYISVHGTIGAMIGSATGNAWLAFALGVLSHFVLDTIPHGDERTDEVLRYIMREKNPVRRRNLGFRAAALFDTIVLTILSGTLLFRGGGNPFAVAAGILGGIFPDLLMGAEEVLRRGKWYAASPFKRAFDAFHWFHYGTHRVLPDPPYLVGLSLQVLLLVVSLKFLLS